MTEQELFRTPRDPRDELLAAETQVEQATKFRGPVGWWRWGMVAVGALAAILLILQVIGGGAGTDVIPGTPVSNPQVQTQ